jgi:purine-binding chemotaxis protein CheW
MSTVATFTTEVTSAETEYVTFYVGDILVGVDITLVEEINRHVDETPVPHAPSFVCGVLNLRGDVVTVVDLRMILGLPAAKPGESTRAVIVRSRDEQIGLRVDRIADVVRSRREDIDPVPPNLSGVDGRLFRGVYKLEGELLAILDVDVALAD